MRLGTDTNTLQFKLQSEVQNLFSYSNVNEEVQNLAMRTHLEVQQREDIRRDLAERMKFVPPDLPVGESVFYWQGDPNKIQQGRKSGFWLKMEIIAVKDPMAVISTGAYIFQVNASKQRRPLDSESGRTSKFV